MRKPTGALQITGLKKNVQQASFQEEEKGEKVRHQRTCILSVREEFESSVATTAESGLGHYSRRGTATKGGGGRKRGAALEEINLA